MSHVRRILESALPGKKSNVERRIKRAERIEKAIYSRFGVTPWRWQAKHVRWFFEVHAKDWGPATRYDAWRELRAVLEAVGKAHVAILLSSNPNASYVRPNGVPGQLSAAGRPLKLAKRNEKRCIESTKVRSGGQLLISYT